MRDCDVVVACSALRKEAVQRFISTCFRFLISSDILKLSSFDTVFSLIFGFLNSFTVSQALTELGSAASIVQFADVALRFSHEAYSILQLRMRQRKYGS